MAYITNPKINNRFSRLLSGRQGIEARSSNRKMLSGLLLGLFFILTFIFLGRFIAPPVISLLSPVIKTYKGFSKNIFYGLQIFEPESTLIAENTALKEKMDRLIIENSAFNSVIRENEALKTELSMQAHGFLSVHVLSVYPQTPYDTIIIDRGESDGLAVGKKVFLSDQIAIGSLEIVSAGQSRVRLFSSTGVSTEVYLERTGEIVNMQGQGGGSFKIELPRNFDITEGDIALLPGSDKSILAEVISIKKDEASPFLQAFLQLPVKIKGNSILYVEK